MKLIIIIFFVLSFISNSFSEPKINARTAILMDHNSGKILFERDADHQIYPASMTKIMTAIVIFDLLKEDKIQLSDEVIVSENAWRMSKSGYSSMFIMLNDLVSVEDLLKGIIIVSGNDACIADNAINAVHVLQCRRNDLIAAFRTGKVRDACGGRTTDGICDDCQTIGISIRQK